MNATSSTSIDNNNDNNKYFNKIMVFTLQQYGHKWIIHECYCHCETKAKIE